MSKMMHDEAKALKILNILMSADDFLTTKQITYRADCNRKTVYNTIAALEINGFSVEVIDVWVDSPRGKVKGKAYKYVGLFGC